MNAATFAADPVELAAAGEHAIDAWGAGRHVEIALLSG